ncbi:MAG: glycosyltransferase family 4 protein [Bacteroidales bacterium]|nr:glycosyltransferase family 4 protein [Bacteroidales bacterium]MCM1147046.1 glycosyltransferase family 4 protein [Bacteroidales bacterium]MCM1205821.1 glycosyltransferase family 4 protein [Bacillota bacterium]MCM1509935.1 glycosyltransferase family 4 protein [Clostridium sp.]
MKRRDKKVQVLVIGSARQSAGGVSSVIKLMEKMPAWEMYSCRWIGTQIQRSYLWKLWYAVRSWFVALFVIWRYDIVHFHTVPDRICLVIQMPIFLLALIGRKRIIMHIHMGNQLRNHIRNSLFLWCLKRADLVILLAKKWERLFREEYSGIHAKTAVLYNACEEIPVVPPSEKTKTIIMAAYFIDNKAPELLLKAWQALKDKYPDWKVYMLGNGEVARYEKMAGEMSLSDTVTFTGYVTGKEKEDYFRKASIYCMCSYEEGFPMVVLESWAYGICVVTTPVGGLPDVIEEGKNCLTFGFGDSEALADRLDNLMSNKELRMEMAQYSRKFVLEKFSLLSIDRELQRIYRNL